MNRMNGLGVGMIGGMILSVGMLAPGASLAQESVAVRAPLISGGVPTDDPAAAIWEKAPVSEFPLSPQVHWPNRILEVTAKSVKVRGLHDGKQIAILVEYADPSEDPDDAAALEFMVGDKMAHFAHGQQMALVEGGLVNIWYWKNKDGRALDMNAKGFGTLKVQDQQDVTGKGIYQDGKWKVVFSRALSAGDAEHDTQFTLGEFVSIAFAIWDGKKDPVSGELKEKGSQKAVSSWWYFRAEPPPDYSPLLYVALAVGLVAGFEFVVIRKLRKGPSA